VNLDSPTVSGMSRRCPDEKFMLCRKSEIRNSQHRNSIASEMTYRPVCHFLGCNIAENAHRDYSYSISSIADLSSITSSGHSSQS
jgi:hypothetical protein